MTDMWQIFEEGDRVVAQNTTGGGVIVTREFDVAFAKIGLRKQDSWLTDADGERYWLGIWDVTRISEADDNLPEWSVTIAFQIEGEIYSTGRTEEEARRRLLEQFGGSLPPVWEMDKETLIASEITQIERV